ncbi:hypothetical protein EMCRGX_G002839 [Ephydatia muelleri]
MGVDLATYRARIGTFISRRNVSDDDERRRIVRAMWRTTNLSKAMVTTNLKYNITSGTHSLEKPIHICSSTAFGFLPTLQHVRPSGYSGLRLYAVAERFALTLVAMSFILIKQLLLLLSGDVETNPGPLGQHTEDPTFTFKNIIRALRPVVQWKSLGIELEISAAKIKEIDHNNRGQVAECKHDMVQFWLESDSSSSWRKLIDALISNDQSVLAEEIKNTYCQTPQDSTLPVLPKSGENISIKELKGRYCNLKSAKVDFPPVPKFSFTNLALIKDTTETCRSAFFYNTIQGSVDDVIETKVTITYEDLFESVTPQNRIFLLEGRPGCGKTTLTRKISRDWGEGTILSFVKYLFLIPLRQFYATPIIELSSILEYFALSVLETEIRGNTGHGVCFIFDGLDEYSQKYTADGRSWFEQLLRGEVLTSSIIMITSRPNASVQLRESVHIRGEVLGFLKKQVDEYIDKSYSNNPSKASEVKAYLHNHQNIQHICYVPLHLVMIIFIYNTCEEDKAPLPKTETDVYNLFTVMSLVRYYRKMGRTVKLNQLKLLPSSELSLFRSICKLAYNTTVLSKTSISLHDVNDEFSISDVVNLGIIIADQKEGLTGGEPVLSFVHLTNQEFLAAYHVSTLPPDEQLKAVREHVGQPHMSVVLKFFCGITGLQDPDHWTSILDNALIDEDDEKKVNLKAMHCVFESQNGQRCRELFSKAGGDLVILNETLTLLDYCVAGYCLESASDAVKSITLRCQLTAEGLEIIVQKLTRSLESVTELEIRDDLCDKDKISALKELLHRFPKVKSLK